MKLVALVVWRMPTSGVVGLAVEDPSVTAMERTHELARIIGAPDLTEGFLSETESGKAFPATHSAGFARILGKGARATAEKSLARRRVPGWCRKGHQLTAENTTGNQCLTCKSQRQRERRSAQREQSLAA